MFRFYRVHITECGAHIINFIIIVPHNQKILWHLLNTKQCAISRMIHSLVKYFKKPWKIKRTSLFLFITLCAYNLLYHQDTEELIDREDPVDKYIFAWVACLLCCWPIGIPAIITSKKARDKHVYYLDYWLSCTIHTTYLHYPSFPTFAITNVRVSTSYMNQWNSTRRFSVKVRPAVRLMWSYMN